MTTSNFFFHLIFQLMFMFPFLEQVNAATPSQYIRPVTIRNQCHNNRVILRGSRWNGNASMAYIHSRLG